MVTIMRLQQHGSNAAEAGFTLVELLVASVVSMLVLGGAVVLTSQVQSGYRRQIESAAAEQEGRYALEWIGKLIRGADNDPFNLGPTLALTCTGEAYDAIQFDPDADGDDNDIRLQSDSNPPDGKLGGPNDMGDCDQANEDVTITFDSGNNVIVFLDNNLGDPAAIRTDAVIEDLEFVFFNGAHEEMLPSGVIPKVAANVRYVDIRIKTRSRTLDPATGLPVTRAISSEVRVRSR